MDKLGVAPIAERLFAKDHLHRVLDRPQITGIAFAGTIGIGVFVMSGEMVSIGGSLGCLLGFVIAGFIAISVMRSMAEMVSVRPVFAALLDFPGEFVDKSLGFAVGMIYWAAQCISMAVLTVGAARCASDFTTSGCLTKSQEAGIVTALLVLTVMSHVLGVRAYGQLERAVKLIKYFVLIAVCVLMIVVNVGVGGYPTENKSRNYTEFGFPPSFRPDGFLVTGPPTDSLDGTGIPGSRGQFLAVWTCVTIGVFACMGGDIVIVAAGEAKHPRRDLPAAARFMYLAPIGLNVLGAFLLGFNVNYTIPDLNRPWTIPTERCASKPSPSPFNIVLRQTSLAPDVVPASLNALFLFSAYTAANTALYVSSRTLFGVARIYGSNFIRSTLGTTNNGNTPLAAIFFSATLGLLAYLCLIDDAFDQPILSLSKFFTNSLACVYASECIAYLRFKRGLTIHERNGILSRNDKTYQAKHYRAHWQPLWALLGLIFCLLLIIFSAWPSIYIIHSRKSMVQERALKPNYLLAFDILGAYVGPFLFLVLYFGHKLIYATRIRTFDDFKDAYILPEFDKDPEDAPHVIRGRGFRAYLKEFWSLAK